MCDGQPPSWRYDHRAGPKLRGGATIDRLSVRKEGGWSCDRSRPELILYPPRRNRQARREHSSTDQRRRSGRVSVTNKISRPSEARDHRDAAASRKARVWLCSLAS